MDAATEPTVTAKRKWLPSARTVVLVNAVLGIAVGATASVVAWFLLAGVVRETQCSSEMHPGTCSDRPARLSLWAATGFVYTLVFISSVIGLIAAMRRKPLLALVYTFLAALDLIAVLGLGLLTIVFYILIFNRRQLKPSVPFVVAILAYAGMWTWNIGTCIIVYRFARGLTRSRPHSKSPQHAVSKSVATIESASVYSIKSPTTPHTIFLSRMEQALSVDPARIEKALALGLPLSPTQQSKDTSLRLSRTLSGGSSAAPSLPTLDSLDTWRERREEKKPSSTADTSGVRTYPSTIVTDTAAPSMVDRPRRSSADVTSTVSGYSLVDSVTLQSIVETQADYTMAERAALREPVPLKPPMGLQRRDTAPSMRYAEWYPPAALDSPILRASESTPSLPYSTWGFMDNRAPVQRRLAALVADDPPAHDYALPRASRAPTPDLAVPRASRAPTPEFALPRASRAPTPDLAAPRASRAATPDLMRTARRGDWDGWQGSRYREEARRSTSAQGMLETEWDGAPAERRLSAVQRARVEERLMRQESFRRAAARAREEAEEERMWIEETRAEEAAEAAAIEAMERRNRPGRGMAHAPPPSAYPRYAGRAGRPLTM